MVLGGERMDKGVFPVMIWLNVDSFSTSIGAA